jgi:hypothetical protein
MFRSIYLAVFALMLAAPLAAQAPENLMMRLDRSTSAEDPDDRPDVTVTAVEGGIRVATGPAVVIYDPAHRASGEYTVSATFTLEETSPPQANGNPHVNFYGLVFGGDDLDLSTQRYVYFLVDFTGRFLVRHRSGDAVTRADDAQAVQTIQAATPNAAIRPADASGRSVNDLEVRVRASDIQYVVNGTVVHTTPREGLLANTDGIYGVRVNHVLPSTVITNLRMNPGR